MDDYVRLPRAALTDELWRNPCAARLYFYFLRKARDNGCWVVSFKEIQRDMKLSRQQYRTALELLKSTALITTSATASATTVTIGLTTNKRKSKTALITTSATASATTKKQARFIPPTDEEVAAYVTEKGYHFNPEQFVPHYQKKGWMVGKSPMVDWRAACRTWEVSWKEKYGERFYYEIRPAASAGAAGTGRAFSGQADRYSDLERVADTILFSTPDVNPA